MDSASSTSATDKKKIHITLKGLEEDLRVKTGMTTSFEPQKKPNKPQTEEERRAKTAIVITTSPLKIDRTPRNSVCLNPLTTTTSSPQQPKSGLSLSPRYSRVSGLGWSPVKAAMFSASKRKFEEGELVVPMSPCSSSSSSSSSSLGTPKLTPSCKAQPRGRERERTNSFDQMPDSPDIHSPLLKKARLNVNVNSTISFTSSTSTSASSSSSYSSSLSRKSPKSPKSPRSPKSPTKQRNPTSSSPYRPSYSSLASSASISYASYASYDLLQLQPKPQTQSLPEISSSSTSASEVDADTANETKNENTYDYGTSEPYIAQRDFERGGYWVRYGRYIDDIIDGDYGGGGNNDDSEGDGVKSSQSPCFFKSGCGVKSCGSARSRGCNGGGLLGCMSQNEDDCDCKDGSRSLNWKVSNSHSFSEGRNSDDNDDYDSSGCNSNSSSQSEGGILGTIEDSKIQMTKSDVKVIESTSASKNKNKIKKTKAKKTKKESSFLKVFNCKSPNKLKSACRSSSSQRSSSSSSSSSSASSSSSESISASISKRNLRY